MLIQYLEDELRRRKSRNSKYSLRAFAASLDIDPSTFSSLLKRKRKLSSHYQNNIVSKLNIEDPKFLRSIQFGSYTEVQMDEFNAIADWEHFTILCLLKSSEKPLSTIQIAQAFKVSENEIKPLLKRLSNLSYISQIGLNKWRLQVTNVKTTTDIPNEALKECHRQHIQKASEAIDTQKVDERDITGITFAFPQSKVKKAKKMLADFRREFCKEFETELQNDEIYRLNLQFFKLTKKISGDKI